MQRLPLFSVAALAVASLGVAQIDPVPWITKRDLNSGVGRPTYGPVDLDAATGSFRHLGCAYLNGEFYVSTRGLGAVATPPHTMYVFDGAGALTRQFTQQGSAASTWGYRDGASDDVATLVFGFESTIVFIDANGAFTTTIQADNGPQTVASPTIPSFTGDVLNTARAMAYNPSGNGGNGSLYIGDFGSDIVELDLNGAEIGRIPANGSWSLYGLAYDPMTGNLWGNCSPNGELGRIVEIDPVAGAETGLSFDKPEGIQGGLDYVTGGVDGRNMGADLVSVVQGSVDSLTAHRLHLYDTLLANAEIDLLSGRNGTGLDDAGERGSFATDSSWDLDLDDGDPTPRAFDVAAFAINLPPNGAVDGVLDPLVATLFPELGEIRYLDSFTSPMAAGMTLYVPTTEAAGPLSLGMNAIRTGLGAMQGDQIRIQAVYGDLNVPGAIPVMFTNQTRLTLDYTPAFGVSVAATGTNSFNSDTAAGFWTITNSGPFEIIGAQITLVDGIVWDADQTGMADRFDGGNSTLAGCLGTYRNSSDVNCDLDYNGTPASACDATAFTGFILENPTLTFTFLDSVTGANGGFGSGKVFEWDCDTDGGGTSGDAHAGAIVTITVVDPVTATVYASQRALEISANPNEAIVTM